MVILIRPATMKDYEAVCNVLSEADVLHSARLPWRFRAVDPQLARTREYIDEILHDPNSRIFVSEIQGHINGAIKVTVSDTLPIPLFTPRRYASIDIIGVLKEQQRRGIGRSLMARAEEWARSLGAQAIELSVYAFNQQAIQFYEGLGYEELSKKMTKKL